MSDNGQEDTGREFKFTQRSQLMLILGNHAMLNTLHDMLGEIYGKMTDTKKEEVQRMMQEKFEYYYREALREFSDEEATEETEN